MEEKKEERVYPRTIYLRAGKDGLLYPTNVPLEYIDIPEWGTAIE